MELTGEQKFDALKLRYTDHVELLRSITKLDVQIFSGHITVQLALGAWLATHSINGYWPKIGVMLIHIVLATIASKLLYKDYLRRKEVVAIIKNINMALGFDSKGIYLPNISINVPTQTRPWFPWFLVGIAVGVLGIMLVVFCGLATVPINIKMPS
jgi:hypothetical protein